LMAATLCADVAARGLKTTLILIRSSGCMVHAYTGCRQLATVDPACKPLMRSHAAESAVGKHLQLQCASLNPPHRLTSSAILVSTVLCPAVYCRTSSYKLPVAKVVANKQQMFANCNGECAATQNRCQLQMLIRSAYN
jgi:hypothetical protein